MVDALIEEGILSYDDLSVTEPDTLAEMTGMELETVEALMAWAERKAEEKPAESAGRGGLGTHGGRQAAAQKAAAELLGDAVEKPAEDKTPSARELFGEDAAPTPAPEKKLTADELFKNLPGDRADDS
jgi:type IV secretory pathway VirB10-like protein